ncbi:hypothetical protein PhCBS80983_g03768 [Powellomyces hirtus]|uniref:Cupin type-2 domain-containing protein n=1 Tax=Powellomyces hirtus TaxID=109895 RepID=A0A507E169_9FUNG|nr:hypothetical protein PhCBS80983_g03768 [Powellomyces hirtus]
MSTQQPDSLPTDYSQSHPLLSARTIARMSADPCPHPLNAAAIHHAKSLGDAVGLQHVGIHFCTLDPLTDSTVFHWHHTDDEWVYILSGRGVLKISKEDESGCMRHREVEEVEIGPGDFMGFKRHGRAHALRNTQVEEKLVFLCGGERNEDMVVEYPLVNKMLRKANGKYTFSDLP